MKYPKIAIKGSTVGTDVIKYLESLGGKNAYYTGDCLNGYYYVNQFGKIEGDYEESVPKDYTLLESIPKQNKIYELW